LSKIASVQHEVSFPYRAALVINYRKLASDFELVHIVVELPVWRILGLCRGCEISNTVLSRSGCFIILLLFFLFFGFIVGLFLCFVAI
jgi:hypothetical protein